MAIQGKRFARTGAPVQVGGLKTSDSVKIAAAGNAVFDANEERVVEIHNLSSSDCFFNIKIGAASGTTPSSASGSGFIAAKNCTRPFTLPANAYVKTTQDILVVSLDAETDA